MNSPASRVVQHVRQMFHGDMAGLRDGQLLQRFAGVRDEQAFAILVQRHGPLVLGVCRRILQSLHDAEDAFQATFLVLSRRASAIRKPDSLASWLYEVAYRLARKMKADASKRRGRETKVPPPAPVEPVDLAGRELQTVLDEELQGLADKYRQPLLLCYLEGRTQEEAARQLGWPRGTLKRRLERGRELLKVQLGRRGFGAGAAIAVALPAAEALALPVPRTLGANTSQAAALFAARQIVPAGLTSGRVVALAEATLRTVLAAKLKIFAGAVLAAGLVCWATLLWAQRGSGADAPAALAVGQGEPQSKQPAGEPSKKHAGPVTMTVELPKEKPTVAAFNGGQFEVTVQLKNAGDNDVVVWPYLTVKLLDSDGHAIKPARRLGKYGVSKGDQSILEKMDFVTLKPGQAQSVPLLFNNLGKHDPEFITAYQLPGQGEFILEVNYQYDRAAVKKRFGAKAKDIDDRDRPWNRALEFEKKVEVRIQVMADENDEKPQTRNRCPPVPNRPYEIAEAAHPFGVV